MAMMMLTNGSDKDSKKEEEEEERRPRDLKGLLKFCLQYTKKEDASGDTAAVEMDAERRKWLEKVLKEMSVDVIKELTDAIQILDEPVVMDEKAEDLSKQEYAFECIEDWVGQIDTANNFLKIGGDQVLWKCLESPHASIRSGSANIIAELCQNNPYCQKQFTEEGFIPVLNDLVNKDRDPTVRTKALYGITCMTRNFTEGQRKWEAVKGPSVLLKATEVENSTRLRTKACFHVLTLCEENPRFVGIFVEKDLVGKYVKALRRPYDPSDEFAVRGLLVVVKKDKSAMEELRKDGEDIRKHLSDRIKRFEGEDSCDEVSYYEELLNML